MVPGRDEFDAYLAEQMRSERFARAYAEAEQRVPPRSWWWRPWMARYWWAERRYRHTG